MVLITRRLEPGVLLIYFKVLERRLRPGVLRFRLALIRILPALIAVPILIPGVRHVFRYIRRIDLMNFRQIVAEDGPAWQVEPCRVLHASLRIVTITEKV